MSLTCAGRSAAPKREAEGWFNGPPYTVAERVFDEHDQTGCTLARQPEDEEFSGNRFMNPIVNIARDNAGRMWAWPVG
jgi:hypothetical protein